MVVDEVTSRVIVLPVSVFTKIWKLAALAKVLVSMDLFAKIEQGLRHKLNTRPVSRIFFIFIIIVWIVFF